VPEEQIYELSTHRSQSQIANEIKKQKTSPKQPAVKSAKKQSILRQHNIDSETIAGARGISLP
jgi:hypothetical protein